MLKVWTYIILHPHLVNKDLQIYLETDFFTKNGLCTRNGDSDDNLTLWNGYSMSFSGCIKSCRYDSECVAFSYDLTPDSNGWNCQTYHGKTSGYGSGRTNTTCYIRSGTCIHIYISMKDNCTWNNREVLKIEFEF